MIISSPEQSYSHLSVAQIIDCIQNAGELPTIAQVMRKVIAIKAFDSSVANYASVHQANDLLLLASSDAAFTARLIRAANDPNSYQEPVFTIAKALNRLGLVKSRNLMLSVPFIEEDDNSKFPGLFNCYHWLWDRHLFNASGAEIIAKYAGVDHDELEFQTYGLIMDMSIMFLLYHFPEQYSPVINRWRNSGGNLSDIENETFGFDHTIVGQHIVKFWNLGVNIEQVARHNFNSFTRSNNKDNNQNTLSGQILTFTQLTTGYFFEDRLVSRIEDLHNYASQKLNIPNDKIASVLQEISLRADAVAMSIADTSASKINPIDLMRAVNTELRKLTISNEQLIRELEAAWGKVETLSRELREANEKLKSFADRDPLTKLFNRRFFEEFLKWNFNRAKRYGTTLGCLMIDIDHFKYVNDTFGHLTGDKVLQAVAESLNKDLRQTDLVARFGGEEFIVLLPETQPESVVQTSERIRKSIEELQIPNQGSFIKVTVSIGYACYSKSSDINNPDQLIELSDQNMYAAKRNGRNRIWP